MAAGLYFSMSSVIFWYNSSRICAAIFFSSSSYRNRRLLCMNPRCLTVVGWSVACSMLVCILSGRICVRNSP